MKILTVLVLTLVIMSCGPTPAPAPQVRSSVQPTSPANAAPPVVAQQPFPASTQGSAARVATPAAAPPADSGAQSGADSPEQRAEATIPSGTSIQVRLNQTLDTSRNRVGDRFTATLVKSISEHGKMVLPKGTSFTGHVTAASSSGRMEGRAVLGVTLDAFEIKGQRYPLVTTRASRVGERHKKRNLVLIGGSSGLGAMIGGLAGGGKGALIGAGAGAGAGTAGAALTGKKDVALPAETLLTFRLEEAVEL